MRQAVTDSRTITNEVDATQTISVTLPLMEDTEHLGDQLGKIVKAGDLILLAGPLGAGKTALVRGLARGLGVLGRVSSPTFVLARVHEPSPRGQGIRLVHVDAYRLGDSFDELDDLDLDTELVGSVVAVEWGEGSAERLSEDHLLITLHREDDDVRIARLTPRGAWVDRDLSAVASQFQR